MDNVQLFREDEDDIKNRNIWLACFNHTLGGLREFFENAYNMRGLGEILYDNEYTELSKAIKKEIFQDIYNTIFLSFTKIGTYESLITILKSVFGQKANIVFNKPDPGVLEISIKQNAIDEVEWAIKESGKDGDDAMAVKENNEELDDAMAAKENNEELDDFIFQLSINKVLIEDVIDLLNKVLKPAGMRYLIKDIGYINTNNSK